MPKYYFDIRDENGVHYDEIGIEMPDIDAARHEAWRALGEMMHEDISRTGKAVIAIDIRVDTGRSVIEVVAASDDREMGHRQQVGQT